MVAPGKEGRTGKRGMLGPPPHPQAHAVASLQAAPAVPAVSGLSQDQVDLISLSRTGLSLLLTTNKEHFIVHFRAAPHGSKLCLPRQVSGLFDVRFSRNLILCLCEDSAGKVKIRWMGKPTPPRQSHGNFSF